MVREALELSDLEGAESICRRREKWRKEDDVGVGSEHQVPKLVDRRQATQVMKSGERRSSHPPSHAGV